MKSIPICDAVKKVCLLIKHQFVALIQHWQQLSPCALPMSQVLSFKFHHPGHMGYAACAKRTGVVAEAPNGSTCHDVAEHRRSNTRRHDPLQARQRNGK